MGVTPENMMYVVGTTYALKGLVKSENCSRPFLFGSGVGIGEGSLEDVANYGWNRTVVLLVALPVRYCMLPTVWIFKEAREQARQLQQQMEMILQEKEFLANSLVDFL